MAIATITLIYTFPLAATTTYAYQVAQASAPPVGTVPLNVAPYQAKIPLREPPVSDTTVQNGTDIVRTLVYVPLQPQFDSLFAAPGPTFAQAEFLVKNLWTNRIAMELCTTVTEKVVVA